MPTVKAPKPRSKQKPALKHPRLKHQDTPTVKHPEERHYNEPTVKLLKPESSKAHIVKLLKPKHCFFVAAKALKGGQEPAGVLEPDDESTHHTNWPATYAIATHVQ